jgi:hypothetical protein
MQRDAEEADMTSQPTIATRPAQSYGERRDHPSREELAELERELDLYVAFWADSRDARPRAAKEEIR